MGLTDRQILWKVELPLATPEIIAGLRISTVTTVAATVAPTLSSAAKSPVD
jgi:osmoprotectant transport system permease protein